MKDQLLGKGANIALVPQAVTFHVEERGTPLDVSALLLGPDGRVRADTDLVFYNHPAQDGVSLSGHTVTAALPDIPAGVDSFLVVAAVDPLHPGTVFGAAPVLTIRQAGAGAVGFTPPDFTARETVVVLAEVYRRDGGWKVRAVGQGYASGLAGLATDYGVEVESRTAPVAAPAPPARGTRLPAVPTAAPAAAARSAAVPAGPPGPPGLAKVGALAPALAEPARAAGQALVRTGAAGRRAAVYLILGHDWDTKELYESFAVQAFAERVLALSVNLDDDGVVPVIFSSRDEPFLEEIGLDDYRGRIGRLHTQVDWGWGNIGAAMRAAVDHYQESGATDPAFVIVQVSDDPWDKAEFRALLQNTASLGVFWLFVGFGRGKLAFYKNLNASTSARFTNTAFCEVGRNPGAVPGDLFYADLVDAFGAWSGR